MPFRSIRARLTVAFSLSLAILIIIAICGLIWYSKSSAERNIEKLLMATAKRAAFESSELQDPAELLKEEREDLTGSDLAINILDKHGRLIGKPQKNMPISTNRDDDWRIYREKLKSGETVIVGMLWVKTRTTLKHHTILLIWLGSFVIVIASIGAWLLIGRTLTPISALTRQAKASSTDNLFINLKSPSQDREMLELVGILNDLLRRITETTAAKGRFYSAASHELRTPLQALSGHLELALSRDRSKEEYKAAVDEAYAQTRRLISLVRALLFLYQLDSSPALPSRESVDLTDVCKRSLCDSQPIIEERGLRVNTRMPVEMPILAPSKHIDILIRNLIENAAKYTSEHGLIDITIEAKTKVVCFRITNDCVLPRDWKPEEFFEPFSRPDVSRNARTGGTGLGLTICKSIADINNWKLDLESEAQKVRAVLIIPCDQGENIESQRSGNINSSS